MQRLTSPYLPALLVVTAAFLTIYRPDENKAPSFRTPTPSFEVHRVAHAGGGIQGKTYTNSLEALSYNISKGFKYFELDFSFTRDGKLVCLHDWKTNFLDSFGFFPAQQPSLSEFIRLVEEKSGFRNCTLQTLSEWMKKNPSATIITDVKDDNLRALRIIRHRLPNADRRVIPQIYDPNNFSQVKQIGFEQVIWTLYRLNITNEEVLSWTSELPSLSAITMPERMARTQLPKLLRERGIPTYVHTINDESDHSLFLRNGISDIYTDFLKPDG